ncbi:MAG: SCO family protein [Cytophagales bacterium]|nr:SCO family protein [Cytophagales bacterium]
MKKIIFALALVSLLVSCETKTLPYIDLRETGTGKHYTIPAFSFENWDGQTITNETLKGKIYVADFFFTSCPGICPVMQNQMARVQKEFEGNPNIYFLSHSLDPDNDSKEVLKSYAERLGADTKSWFFVRGSEEDIYKMAGQGGYFIPVEKNKDAPGGIDHSGRFILVDKSGNIRGKYYEGTDEESVDQLIDDLKTLLEE